MEGLINYVQNQTELMEVIISLLQLENDCQVLMTGSFDNLIYKEILNTIMNYECLSRTKIMIPLVSRNGVIGRSYINKICGNGGSVKINSQYRRSTVIIGKYVVLLSFFSKYTSEHGLRSYFESAVITDKEDIVDKLKNNFYNMWDNALPLLNE